MKTEHRTPEEILESTAGHPIDAMHQYSAQQLAEFKAKMYPEIGKAYNQLMEMGYDGDLNILGVMHGLQQKFKEL